MKQPIDKSVFSPQQAGALTINHLQKLKEDTGGGIKTGIKSLDEYLSPMRGGELITVQGYTSHYKSGFMDFCAASAATQIEGNEDEIVIQATWEQSVEESTLNWVARQSNISLSALTRGKVGEDDWKIVMKAYSERLTVPMWIIGHSLGMETSRPRLSMNEVYKGVQYVCEKATDRILHPRLIILDYLQRMRPDSGDGGTRREQMMEAVNKAKDLAIAFDTPVMLGVQSKREVLDRKNKLPHIDDGQESSNIEQSSDKAISLWYPIKTEEEGDTVQGCDVTEHLLIVGVLKQKLGPAPDVFPVYINPATNYISDLTRQKEYL